MVDGHFYCFGYPFGCEYVLKDKFCPLKESCLARTAEYMGFREPKEDTTEMKNRLRIAAQLRRN
jgi:hypothetical protein